MKQHCLALLLAVPFLLSSPAWALFDAQVLTGKRSSEFKLDGKTNTESGNELKFAAHLDPIPLVPIGFGLVFGQTTFDKSDKLRYSSMDGKEISAEIEAWLPIDLGGFQFYGKVGYTLLGAYVAKIENDVTGNFDAAFKAKGSYVAVGAKYLFLLRLGVMLEYEIGNRTLTFDELKNLPEGLDASSFEKDIDAKSSSFLLGVQAGI